MKTKKIILFAILFALYNLQSAISNFVFSQNISINTTGAANSTSSMLEILQPSTTSGTSGLFVRHSGATTTAYGLWVELTGAVTNKYAIIVPNGSGNVGFGTSSPAAQLHVVGDNMVDGTVYVRNAATPADYGRLLHSGAGGNFHLDTYGTGGLFLNFFSGTNTYVGNGAGGYVAAFLNNGNVGINQTNPGAKLEVVGTPSVTIKIVDGNQAAGKVLTSLDASGNAGWQPLSTGGCSPKTLMVTSGTATLAVTANTFVMVTMCGGGGGGGGGGTADAWTGAGGGGGGAEGYFYYPVSVNTTETWTITVGAGGSGGAISSNGVSGGATTIAGASTILTAAGGTRGTPGQNSPSFCVYGGNGGNGGGVGAGGGGAAGGAGACTPTLAGDGGSISPLANYAPGGGGGGGGGNNNSSGGAGLGGAVGPISGGAKGSVIPGGGGGSCLLGHGGTGGRNNGTTPATPAGYGGGGGGGGGCCGSQGGSPTAGGNGASGVVIIYYWQ